MATLEMIQIDDSPANVLAMMGAGQFHAHQDGRWRYSPYGGDTAHVNDPTAKFPERRSFGDHLEACAHPGAALFAIRWSDGTRGLTLWKADSQRMLWQMYGPRNAEERDMRDWLAGLMG